MMKYQLLNRRILNAITFASCFWMPYIVTAQCYFGTGNIASNTEPFATGSAQVQINGNNVTVTGDVSMPGGTYNFADFTVNDGVTITVTPGNGPLIIYCSGVATIDGSILSDGGNGLNGVSGVFSGGTGGAGGAGGGGWGAPGGRGGNSGSSPNGISGTSFGSSAGGGIGGVGASGSGPFAGAGGGGAGYSASGNPGQNADGGTGGAAGQEYGDISLSVFMTHNTVNSNLLGGSGGGGGGARGSITVHGGGGGGGGGGAIRIAAPVINFGESGFLSAKGGNGGISSNSGGAYGGSGGGGSGGSIHLQYNSISGFTEASKSDVSGGSGGPVTPGGTRGGAGGDGASGRVYLETCLQTNSISTGTLNTSYCAESFFSVPFTITGTFEPGNIFTAQISDASGSFSSPTSIGSLAAVSGGSIFVTLPAYLPAGSGYRIRVISDNPSVIGNDNGIDISVQPPPQINSASPAYSICSNSSPNIVLTSPQPGASFSWTSGSGHSGSGSPINDTLVNNTCVDRIVTYTASASLGGCKGDSVIIPVTVKPKPTSDFIISPDDACVNQDVVVTYTGTSCAGNTFNWTFPPGINVNNGSGSGPYTLTSNSPGEYQIKLSVVGSGGACTSPQTTNSMRVVNLAPAPAIEHREP